MGGKCQLSWPVKSLAPGEAIWRRRNWSTLVEVMACCLTATSHFRNICWLTINEIPWHWFQGNVYLNIKDIKAHDVFEIMHIQSHRHIWQGKMNWHKPSKHSKLMGWQYNDSIGNRRITTLENSICFVFVFIQIYRVPNFILYFKYCFNNNTIQICKMWVHVQLKPCSNNGLMWLLSTSSDTINASWLADESDTQFELHFS